jgi:hypothetical protein
MLGHLDYGDARLNLALNALCFAALYGLLINCTKPLRLAARHYRQLRTVGVPARSTPNGIADPDRERLDASLRRLELHFRWANRYVWLSWHGFPLVWALGAAGFVNGDTREGLYAICDVFAKFLPVSIYVSMLDVRY